MANFVDCQLVTDAHGRHCIVAVTNRPDGGRGCFYTLHQPKGGIVGVGDSSGVGENSPADAAAAMKNGKAAARRWLTNTSRAMDSLDPVLSSYSAPIAKPISAELLTMQGNPARGNGESIHPGSAYVPPHAMKSTAASRAKITVAVKVRDGLQSVACPAPYRTTARDCPMDAISDIFNRICKDLPKVKPPASWPYDRKRALSKAWADHHGLDVWNSLFLRVHASDFMCARSNNSGEQHWQASFDWILKSVNLEKIMAGTYDNRHGHGPRLPLAASATNSSRPQGS